MSLFKTKEWWRTKCGSNETFDRSSLLVAPLFGDDRKDCIVIGSHQGYLRIYYLSSQWQDETKSSTGYKSIDLMTETKLGDCIVDLKAGKLVSGSQDPHLAVLTSSKLIVYTVTLTKGSNEQGDQCNLEIAYEHRLPRFPASLVVGPFGGVRNRDFLCVQCLDGTYQNIAEFGRNGKHEETKNEAAKSLEPEWSYNIGEAVVDIGAVTLSSFEIGIVVLGEKNLYCFKDTGASLKYTKRLDYKALCFHAYVIEPDGKLMVFVIADTSTLMIYEGTTLKWSAQLPFVPVAVTRAHFQYLDGLIVILSEEGQLEACYLGSEPSLFIAPAVHRRGFDYVAAEEELLELRRKLKEMKLSEIYLGISESVYVYNVIFVSKFNRNWVSRVSTGDQLAVTPVTDMELLVNVNISPDLEPCPFVDKESNEDQEIRQLSMCRATIELSSYTTLYGDKQVLQTLIYPSGNLSVMSSEVKITATYENDRGNVRIIQKTTELPLKLMLRACPPENTSTFTVIIKCNESLVGFNQLFPEFSGDHLRRQNWNTLGLQHIQTGHVVTIVSGSTSNRYRVQSNDGLSMSLVVQQLVNRLKDKSTGRLAASISQHHVQLVHVQMELHFLCRQEVDRINTELALLMTQLRNIEKRMLRAARERNSRSLTATGLSFLLSSTYDAISGLLDDLAAAQTNIPNPRHSNSKSSDSFNNIQHFRGRSLRLSLSAYLSILPEADIAGARIERMTHDSNKLCKSKYIATTTTITTTTTTTITTKKYRMIAVIMTACAIRMLQKREHARHGLHCALRLLLLLLRLNVNNDKYTILESAIGFEAQLRDEVNWEEVADAGLAAFLRSVSKKQANNAENKSFSWNKFTSMKDVAKLKKRLTHAVERLDDSKESGIDENETESGNFNFS
ncbi:protein PTHB1 isoform X1 [Vespula squamosa]|uniref:Protein PTHB1 isoform X1 n=1 Tax=Vespula squamosa TaxID=30214 RepID=A0ABD2AE91_VESSQ